MARLNCGTELFVVLGFNFTAKSNTRRAAAFAGQHRLSLGLLHAIPAPVAFYPGLPGRQRRAPGLPQLPRCSPRPLQRRARAEECGLAALELNDDRGPLECPQSPPHSRPPLSLSLTGVTDGPGFHQPGPTTLSLPAESEIFSGI